MKRISTECGSWFNIEAAKSFFEDEQFDGSNLISLNTNSQWEHERLYLTKSGNWILNSWSQWQGTTETYEIIGEDEATKWLVLNGHEVDGINIEALEV